MHTAEDYMRSKLMQRRENGLLRQLIIPSPMVDFYSNDYLGFARSAQLQQMINDEISNTGMISNGSTGSRLLSGNSEYAMVLEDELAGVYQCEATLLFNSGYDANFGLLSALPQRGDTVLHDELIHASIIDGIRLSHANRQSFRHNDVNHLVSKLQRITGRCYVIVESVYSMDGDTAPLAELAEVCREYNAALIVDEAHALGVFGLGLVQEHQLQSFVFARVATFGKAIGCHGAAVLGSNLLKDYLVNFSRSFIYTTAAPLHQMAAIKMAHQMLIQDKRTYEQLHKNIKLFKQLIADPAENADLIPSNSAIQCLLIRDIEQAKEKAYYLRKNGFAVRAILAPTVAAGSERLRIILHSYNTLVQITRLCNLLKQMNYEG